MQASMSLLVVLVASFAHTAVGSTPTSPVVIPAGWKIGARVSADTRLQLHVFVKQTHIDQLEDTLMRVSDPRSAEYGQHLSFSEVNNLVTPKPESVMVVLAWLQGCGVETNQINTTPNFDILEVNTHVSVAECLLSTRFHRYHHAASGMKVLRAADTITVPSGVAPHVDMVGPSTRFPLVPFKLHSSRTLLPNEGVTPQYLRKLYNIGDAKGMAPNNLQGIAAFLEQYFDNADLQSFFNQFDKQDAGRTPVIKGNNTGEPGIETMLDVEYIMSTGTGVPTQFWYTDGRQPGSPQNEPFLKWLFDLAATAVVPHIFSISYGDNENTVVYDYATRVNAEFIKAGTRGISLTSSSGDGGVSGSQPTECTKFVPTFPAASPYITAIGGTDGVPEQAAGLSSGGFSNYWARPKYQTEPVQTYFSTAQGLPPSDRYNHTGAGFPDVSALAVDFLIVAGGSTEPVSGTSCASPTFAGVVSLLNDLRLQKGKNPLGYLNLLFYQNPSAFNDITQGSNPGCNTNGFPAAQGWDPVTGLGSPDYQKLAAIVSQLR